MKVTLGQEGLSKTWQDDFPETVECCRCKKEARIGFVAHEAIDETVEEGRPFICNMYPNHYKDGEAWMHDCCAVAVYFCKACLHPTAIYNQA